MGGGGFGQQPMGQPPMGGMQPQMGQAPMGQNPYIQQAGMGGGFGGPMGGVDRPQVSPPRGGFGQMGAMGQPQMGGMQGGMGQPQMGGGFGGMQQTAQSLPTATPPPAEQSMNYLRSQGINTNFLQGGMGQSPQMGGFSGGMGVGSSPYSPMGGGYGMGGANPQMDGMGGFRGGQGPQMGGFGQMSPIGGMGQPQMSQAPMAQFGNNFRPMGQFDPQKMQEMRGMQQAGMQGGMSQPQMGGLGGPMGGMPQPQRLPQQGMNPMGGMSGGMGGFGQQRMQPPPNMGQMGDDFVDRRTPEQRTQSQAQMNQLGVRGIMDLMRSRFGQQGRM
jgi:hypothetical protein